MAYIGRDITSLSNASLLDDITFSSSAGPYNLTKSTVAFTPISAQALVISIDGVIQDPGSYTISGSTVTFDTSISSSCTNDFIVHNGVGIVNEVSDGAVTTAKLGTDAVTTAKILDNNVTVAKLPTTLNISGNTVTLPASVSGLGTGIDVTSQITGTVPTANLGSGTGSSANFLRGDSSWQEVSTGTSWQSVETGATFTAVAGNGYPIDTTSNACTVTLPAGSVGDTIELVDYAGTWDTNVVTLTADGSEKIKGSTDDWKLITERQGIKIVYVDATQGWEAITGVNETAPALREPTYGGVEYLLVAGGGGGGKNNAAGGGAGGVLTNYGGTAITLTVGSAYTITVGAGGATQTVNGQGNDGNDSVLSGTGITTVTALGGGSGGASSSAGANGGSGGGGAHNGGAGGSGTVGQGNDGGTGAGSDSPAYGSGGGGGAGAVGGDGDASNGGDGGNGSSNSITGSAVTYAGGGGGYANDSDGNAGSGGTGGGGAGNASTAGVAGTANTGGGGGGSNSDGGAGGSGVVILRMADANYSGTTTGSPTVVTGVSGDTVLTFTGTGSYTG